MDNQVALMPVGLGLNPGSTAYQFADFRQGTLITVLVIAPIPQSIGVRRNINSGKSQCMCFITWYLLLRLVFIEENKVGEVNRK